MRKVCKAGLAVALLCVSLLAVPSAHAEWEHVTPNDSGSYLGSGDPEPADYQGEPDEPFDRVGQTALSAERVFSSLVRLVALIELSVLRWTAR